MLVIRFSRVGKRNHAQFKIVVAEKSAPIKGRFVEQLGSYDPHSKEMTVKKDRIEYWMSQGAQATDSVWNLFVKEGIIKEDKRAVVLRAKKGEKGEESASAEASADKGEEGEDPTSPKASKGADAKEKDSEKADSETKKKDEEKAKVKEDKPKEEPKEEDKKKEKKDK